MEQSTTPSRRYSPPDLAVEVVSPSSSNIDRKDKFAQYRKAGAPWANFGSGSRDLPEAINIAAKIPRLPKSR